MRQDLRSTSVPESIHSRNEGIPEELKMQRKRRGWSNFKVFIDSISTLPDQARTGWYCRTKTITKETN